MPNSDGSYPVEPGERRVISGIIHVLISGGRWIDAPAVYGPKKTLYNRWVRWARAGSGADALVAADLLPLRRRPGDRGIQRRGRAAAPLCARRGAGRLRRRL